MNKMILSVLSVLLIAYFAIAFAEQSPDTKSDNLRTQKEATEKKKPSNMDWNKKSGDEKPSAEAGDTFFDRNKIDVSKKDKSTGDEKSDINEKTKSNGIWALPNIGLIGLVIIAMGTIGTLIYFAARLWRGKKYRKDEDREIGYYGYGKELPQKKIERRDKFDADISTNEHKKNNSSFESTSKSYRQPNDMSVLSERKEAEFSGPLRMAQVSAGSLQPQDFGSLSADIEHIKNEIGKIKAIVDYTVIDDKLVEMKAIISDEIRRINAEVTDVREMFRSYLEIESKHQTELLKEKQTTFEGYGKLSSHKIVAAPMKVAQKFNPQNLIAWWNENGREYFANCDKSLKETFGNNILIEVFNNDPKDKENWYLLAIKESIRDSYYLVLPRNGTPYTDDLKEWFYPTVLQPPRNAVISSLVTPAKSKSRTDKRAFEKGKVEVR